MSLSLDFNTLKTWWQNQRLAFKIVSCFSAYLISRYIFITLYRKFKSLPPGPVGLPILGSFLSLAKVDEFYINLTRKSKYKICSIPMGTTTYFVINDPKLMKYLYSKEETMWRPPRFTLTNGNLSTINKDWKMRRKFFQTHLMTLLDKKFVKQNINILVNNTIIPKLTNCEKNNELYYWHSDFQYITFNVMYNCVFGGYLQKNDLLYARFLNTSAEVLSYLLPQALKYLLFGERVASFIRDLHPFFNKLDCVYQDELDIIKEWAKNAHTKYDKNNLLTYYDLVYNDLSSKLENKNKTWDEIITLDVISDMQAAIEGGTDTTSATLDYCIAIAAKYDYIQDEIYNEIVNITDNIGKYELYNNITKFHKLRAFIQESLRLMVIIPSGLPKYIKNKNGLKIEVDGKQYILPTGSTICSSIIGMQRDPKLWKNADKFDINRWLDNNGKFKKSHQPLLMNFSYGKRDCPGRPLALKSMYLIIALLFSQYKFYYDNPESITIQYEFKTLIHVYPEIGCKVKKRI